MKTFKLSHFAIPYKDETASSFILRNSALNGYSTPKSMLNNSGFNAHSTTLQSICSDHIKFEKVLNNLGLSNANLELVLIKAAPTKQFTFWTNNKLISNKLLNNSMNKFCPECLKEALYWRKNWLLEPYSVCVQHNILLKNGCPKCNQFLPLNRLSLTQCPACHSDITTYEGEKTSSFIDKWLLASLENDFKSFNLEFGKIWTAFNEYYNMLNKKIDTQFILKECYLYFTNKRDFSKNLEKKLLTNTIYIHPQIQVLPFLKANKDLESLCRDIVKSLNLPTAPSPKLINRNLNQIEVCKILGINYVSLTRRIRTGKLFHEELNQNGKLIYTTKILEYWLIYKKEIIYKQRTGKPLYEYKDENAFYYDKRQIAEILNTNIHVIEKFMKMPNSGVTSKYLNGRTKICIARTSIHDFDNKYIFLSSFAKKLGVSPSNLGAKLRALNIFPSDNSDQYSSYYRRSEINHVTKTLLNSITTYQNNTGRKRKAEKDLNREYLCLKECAAILGISQLKTAHLIREKFIKVHNLDQRPYRIPRKSLDKFLREQNDPSFVSIETALLKLNCSLQQLLKNWVQPGFLEIKSFVYWHYIPIQQLEYVLNIRSEYFTAAEANEYLGMHRTHITNLVKQGLIEQHLFGNKSYSVRMFKKADVERLINYKGLIIKDI